MSVLCENWKKIKEDIEETTRECGRPKDDVLIVAVSKTHPYTTIVEGIGCGIGSFGENYAQEFRDKYNVIVESGISQPEWHFIGHLQTNKVKYIVPFCRYIHTVDSLRLAEEIGKYSVKNNVLTKILIQVNTSGEGSKSGVEPSDVMELAQKVTSVNGIVLDGLMCIPAPEEEEEIRKEFMQLRILREKLRKEVPSQPWTHLSMGMSGDYHIAIAEGATIVRIGTAIFGMRDYHIV